MPQWFASWNQEKEDKNQCDLLVAGAKELSLSIVVVSPLVVSKSSEKKAEQGSEVPLTMNRISNSDLAC